MPCPQGNSHTEGSAHGSPGQEQSRQEGDGCLLTGVRGACGREADRTAACVDARLRLWSRVRRGTLKPLSLASRSVGSCAAREGGREGEMVSVLLEFSLQGGSGKSQERGESPAEKLSQRETEQVQRWRDGAPPSPSHPGALLRAQLPSRTRGCPARFAGCHLHSPGSCSGEDLVSFQLLCAVLVGFCIFSDAGWSPPLFPGVVAGPPGCQEGARGGGVPSECAPGCPREGWGQ